MDRGIDFVSLLANSWRGFAAVVDAPSMDKSIFNERIGNELMVKIRCLCKLFI